MFRAAVARLACGLAAAALLIGCSAATERRSKFRVAVIPKGTTHDFWKYIQAGAMDAAGSRGTTSIRWEGPATEDQRREQQQIVERFVGEGVDAIVLAPGDRQTLVAPVEAALKKGIPVVIIDSGLELTPAIRDHPKYLGYVGTNNTEGGAEAARRMTELLKGQTKAKVLMVRYQAGHESTEQRETGFRETIRAAKDIDFIEAPDEAGATVETAQRVAERLLTDRKDLAGFFAPNESSTVGVLRALEVHKLTGKVRLVGFDANDILISALKKDQVQGLVLQDPFEMGREAVTRAIDFLEGKPRPADLTKFTPLQMVTKENVGKRDIRPLFARDLSKYLIE